MKRSLSLAVALLIATTTLWPATGINYNGTELELNNDFTRTECGTSYKKVMKEVSGMACSRETPGYIWIHGDENTDEDKKIVAIKPDGTLAMTVNISNDPGRDDWEDIATGMYGGKNYVFIGAFGDNDLEYKDTYYIYFFEEPQITTSTTQTISVQSIRFGYPDEAAHNTETLMYDNIERTFYIADKVENGVCTLYSLPFRTDYGSGIQTLTKVCELGNGSKFNFLTAGDITPDGQWMAIKSKKYLLLWERQGGESLSNTAKRTPVQVAAYEEEAQGESLAWEDYSTFYTTSDQKKDIPIYKYTRPIDYSKAILTGIYVNDEPLADFNINQFTYDVVLPYGTLSLPVVSATAGNEAEVSIMQVSSLPGTATVVCTSKDGSSSVTYTISFTVSATPSTDATLRSLSVNGSLVSGFNAGIYSYDVTIAYLDELPVVSAVTNDATATVDITQVTEVNKTSPTTATVLVTAQDGHTKLTYTISFLRADAIREFYQITMSNGYNAYIKEGETTIHAFYLNGTEQSTIKNCSLSEGATWLQNGNTVRLTGADGEYTSYALDVQPVQPVAFTEDEIVFDGSEQWVKGAYGWDNTKNWKFSKTDTDHSREMAGKTHIELFLPACDTVILKSMESKEREVRIYVNGVQVGNTIKLLINGTKVPVRQSSAFMLTVASAQSSGDGGVKAIQMIRSADHPTAIDNIYLDGEGQKIFLNGQLLILHEGKLYNLLGIPIAR